MGPYNCTNYKVRSLEKVGTVSDLHLFLKEMRVADSKDNELYVFMKTISTIYCWLLINLLVFLI